MADCNPTTLFEIANNLSTPIIHAEAMRELLVDELMMLSADTDPEGILRVQGHGLSLLAAQKNFLDIIDDLSNRLDRLATDLQLNRLATNLQDATEPH